MEASMSNAAIDPSDNDQSASRYEATDPEETPTTSTDDNPGMIASPNPLEDEPGGGSGPMAAEDGIDADPFTLGGGAGAPAFAVSDEDEQPTRADGLAAMDVDAEPASEATAESGYDDLSAFPPEATAAEQIPTTFLEDDPEFIASSGALETRPDMGSDAMVEEPGMDADPSTSGWGGEAPDWGAEASSFPVSDEDGQRTQADGLTEMEADVEPEDVEPETEAPAEIESMPIWAAEAEEASQPVDLDRPAAAMAEPLPEPDTAAAGSTDLELEREPDLQASIPVAEAAPLSPAVAEASAGTGDTKGSSADPLDTLRKVFAGFNLGWLKNLQELLPALKVIGLAVLAGVTLKLSGGLLHTINSIPALGGLLELLGLVALVTFLYRNALRQKSRAELLQRINELRKDLLK